MLTSNETCEKKINNAGAKAIISKLDFHKLLLYQYKLNIYI